MLGINLSVLKKPWLLNAVIQGSTFFFTSSLYVFGKVLVFKHLTLKCWLILFNEENVVEKVRVIFFKSINSFEAQVSYQYSYRNITVGTNPCVEQFWYFYAVQ